MAKDVKFTMNIKINGKDMLVEAGVDAKRFAQELGIANKKIV